MLGIVVWSKEENESAVIWGEDQDALVYLSGRHSLRARNFWPNVGDLLSFDLSVLNNMRMAENVMRLDDRNYAELRETLENEAKRHDGRGLLTLVDYAEQSKEQCCEAAPQEDKPSIKRVLDFLAGNS